MEDSTLKKLAFIWTVVGLFLLLLFAEVSAPKEISISKVDSHLGEDVHITGLVTSVAYYDTVNFFDVSDGTSTIKVVSFEKPTVNLTEGDSIGISGRVKIYKGELEIVADEISLLQ